MRYDDDEDEEIELETDEYYPEIDEWIRDPCFICHEVKRVKVTETRDGLIVCLCAECMGNRHRDETIDDDNDDQIED